MDLIQCQQAINRSRSRGAASLIDQAILPSREQLIAAARDAQRGNERSKTMLIHYMSRMVYKVAERSFHQWHRRLPLSASFDDVFMAGIEGVLHAVRLYDADSGYAFTTYAKPWIQTKVQRCIYQHIGSLRIPEERLTEASKENSPALAVNALSLDHQIDTDSAQFHEAVGRFDNTIEDDLSDNFATRAALEAARSISDRHYTVARMALEGRYDSEIGPVVGCTTQHARNLRVDVIREIERRGILA